MTPYKEDRDQAKKGFDWWEVLWKINQVIIPCGIAWSIWVTTNIFEIKAWQGQSPAYTVVQAELLELRMKEWVRENSPSADYKNQFKDFQISLKTITTQLEALKLELTKIQIKNEKSK